MKRVILFAAVAALTALSAPLLAENATIKINDPYARSSGMSAKAGAAFMEVMNTGTEPDRLIAASTQAAKRAELHTHKDKGDGVMAMVHVEEGFEVPPGESLILQRGGHHVMLMGLTGPLEQDEMISVTLTFEKAGDITVEVPVDLTRKPRKGHGMSGAQSN